MHLVSGLLITLHTQPILPISTFSYSAEPPNPQTSSPPLPTMAFVSLTTPFTGLRPTHKRSTVLAAPPTHPSRARRSLCITATAVPRNANFAKLQAGYLFPEIGRRRNAYLADNPSAEIISLGVGDTTLPLTPYISKAMSDYAAGLGTVDGYSGYGPEQGGAALREKISAKMYNSMIAPDEIFVSDGAKCDITRVQQVFGPNVSVAVQDPSYPAYVDVSVMQGQTGLMDPALGQYTGIEYMSCIPTNGFFPDLTTVKRTDIIFFCSPNNPTGAVATHEQLAQLVSFAKQNGSIIVYDAAYAAFINDPSLPKSIFEIDGAREVAIEVNSYSKYAGFTGVRLGWTVVPKELVFADGSQVRADFNRVMGTCFNGASNISQAGALACLDPEGQTEIAGLISYYLENATLLRDTMLKLGFEVHGGSNAPYIWIGMPGKKSWDVFEDILNNAQVVTIPGVGFGPKGEGFLRLSAFAPREACIEACKRLSAMYSGVAV